jgi:hypothetical protein
MQRKHQARPPGLLDGMAIPLSEEVLRALQDAVPVYEAVLSKHAPASPHWCLLPALCRSLDAAPGNVAAVLPGAYGLAGLPPLCDQTGVEAPLLVQ